MLGGHLYHDNTSLTICLDRDNVLPVTAENETKKMTKTQRPTRHTRTNENPTILLKINETVHAHSTLLEWLAERLKRSAE
jgi:hypothetical protein